MPVAAVDGARRVRFWAPGVWGDVETRMLDAIGALGARRVDDPVPDAGGERDGAVRPRCAGSSRPFAGSDYGDAGRRLPGRRRLASRRQLAGLAAMLAAGLPLRCVALDAPGEYDTHADQPKALARRRSTSRRGRLLAFQRDLEARGLADRVLTLVWSEFGRRAEENGSERHRPRRRRQRRS